MFWFKVLILVFMMWLHTGPILADTIVYRGSSTIGQFIHEAAKVYKTATFDINTRSESSGGEDAIVAGKADIGGVAREVRPEILDRGIQKHLVGRDAIGILVHRSNSITHLSLDQLAGIFSGEITNWRQVGGNNLPIDVYIVNPRSATRGVVKKKVLGNKAYGGKRIITIRPDTRIAELVSDNPGAIGQLSFSLLKGAAVKLIQPDGESPTLTNSNYPITRNLYLVIPKVPTAATKKFIQWALSPAGQKVVRRHFISKP